MTARHQGLFEPDITLRYDSLPLYWAVFEGSLDVVGESRNGKKEKKKGDRDRERVTVVEETER